MKIKHILSSILLLMTITSYCQTDIYSFRFKLRIPRVYNNMLSLGYRKYLILDIRGTMSIDYDDNGSMKEISFNGFTNLTQRTSSGNKISYEIYLDEYVYQRISVIGNNKTLIFKQGTAYFNIICEPSYSISDIVTEDNALYLLMSSTNGKFRTNRNGRKILYSMSGFAVGTVGCSCADYGHISPTRLLGFYGPSLCDITDVAATEGKWKIQYMKTIK